MNHYHFKVGDFSCLAISDGGLNYPVETFFKDIPGEQITTLLRAHHLPTTHVYTPYTLLYVDTGSHKVLVDTGMGLYGALAGQMFPEVDNATTGAGALLKNMGQAGIDPSEIDTVIITHAHPDHIGGNLDSEGRLNFPQAHYFVSRAEWEFWFSDERVAELPLPPPLIHIARTGLEPLRDRLTLIEPETEIVPGISVISTPGHTPGHISLAVRSGEQRLLHLADAVVHPLHIEHQEMLLTLDLLPAQTLVSRRLMCERAEAEQTLVFAHHLPPFPNLGHIVRQGDGWRWQPVAVLQTESEVSMVTD